LAHPVYEHLGKNKPTSCFDYEVIDELCTRLLFTSYTTATYHSHGVSLFSPQPIFTQNGLIDVDSRKNVPFAVKSKLF